MQIEALEIKGSYLIKLPIHEDRRGSFERKFCAKEFEHANLCTNFVQTSISSNLAKGTLRGMHYQIEPAAEVKLVSVVQGSILDVIVDFRPDSKTYLKSLSIELSDKDNLALYIPKLCLHGFQSLSPNTKILYQISEFYQPLHARGFAYNSPCFNITWPLPPIISEKDANFDIFIP